MKKIRYLFRKAVVYSASGFFMIWSQVSLRAKENEAKEIVIIKNNWSSQLVLAEIAGQLIQKQGMTVRYKTLPVAKQWGDLARNLSDIQVEVWEGTMAKDFDKMVSVKSFFDGGTYQATTREEWWYPDYSEKKCPGLPDWKALKNCGAAFSTPDSNGKGVYFSGPWEKPDRVKIAALDLPFIVKNLKDGDALWVELAKAVKENRPVMLFNWSPNWVEAVYPGKFVEFPKYHPECETKASWGLNPGLKYDCGNPVGGWLKKALSKNLQQNFPKAFEIMKKMDFSATDISGFARDIDFDKMTPEDSASRWIKKNEAIWSQWVR